MINTDILYDDYCIITFSFNDGSKIQCCTTLNLDILERLGLLYVDGFVDLLSYKIIPQYLFLESSEIIIEKGKDTNLLMLDEFFIKSIKKGWVDV